MLHSKKIRLPPAQKKINDWLLTYFPDAEFLTADGMEAAFVGVVERLGQPLLACYDYDRCLECLMRDGMTWEEAVEFFDFNIGGAWVGEATPCFLHRAFSQDLPAPNRKRGKRGKQKKSPWLALAAAVF